MFTRIGLALMLAAPAVPAMAAPRHVIVLRHGEKAGEWSLCATGQARAAALAGNYIGKGAPNGLAADSGCEK